MKKKGVSAIVATVLIILIVVFSVGIMWIQILPMIQNFSRTAKVNAFLVDERMSIYAFAQVTPGTSEKSTNYLEVVVNRGTTSLSEFGVENVSEVIIVRKFNPTDVFLLFDLSGDINSEKCGGKCIEILQSASKAFVDKMLPEDSETEIAFMGFGKDFDFLDFTSDKSALYSEINAWQGKANTLLYERIQLVYDEYIGRDPDKEKILVILGAGDIDLNKDGPEQAIIDFAAKFPNDLGVKVHTIGYSTAANTPFYQAIAANGSGNYYAANDTDSLTEVFSQLIKSTNYTYYGEHNVALPGTFLDIVIFKGGDSFVKRIKHGIPGSGEGRTFTIDLEADDPEERSWTVDEITRVEVYLVIAFEGEYVSSRMAGYDM